MVRNMNNCNSFLLESDTRLMTLKIADSSDSKNDVRRRLNSSCSSLSSNDEPSLVVLTSFDLPSPWDVKESHFHYASSSPGSKEATLQTSNNSICRQQDQMQECDDERDEYSYHHHQPNYIDDREDICNNNRRCIFSEHRGSMRRFQSSPERKHIVTSSQLTKRRYRSWIRLATPIGDSHYDDDDSSCEEIDTTTLQNTTTSTNDICFSRLSVESHSETGNTHDLFNDNVVRFMIGGRKYQL